MLTIKEIQELLKDEQFDTLLCKLEKELSLDPLNPEYLYYRFLVKNKDYSNIDFDNIKDIEDYNKAIDLSNTRLKIQFTSEFSFFKVLSNDLRKCFLYSFRYNVEAFKLQLKEINFAKGAFRINDDYNTFISNLDYVITSSVNPLFIDMNLLSVNLLYLIYTDDKILSIYNLLHDRSKEIKTSLSNMEMAKSKTELFDLIDLLNNELKRIDLIKNHNDMMELGKSPNDKIINLSTEELKIKVEERLEYKTMKYDSCGTCSKALGIIAFIASFMMVGILPALLGIIFGFIGHRSKNSQRNGSTMGIFFSLVAIFISILTITLFIIRLKGESY